MINLSKYIFETIKKKNIIESNLITIVQTKIDSYDYTIIGTNKLKLNEREILEKTEFDGFQIKKINNFYNIILKKEFLLEIFQNVLFGLSCDKLIEKTYYPQQIVIDYSSPNVAKEMHIGHLRSTIIGDTLANFYEYIGHNVLRINHIGDFGLQFGMMVWYIESNNLINQIDSLNLQDLYVTANDLAKTNNDFASQAQLKTFELQNNIEPAITIHKKICDKSREHFEKNYSYLNISKMIETGESFYQNLIPQMILELNNLGLIEEDTENNAISNEQLVESKRKIIKTNIRGKNSALTIVKSNGAYTYDTTDWCAIKYRCEELNADKILYVVDSGQSEHFEQVFQIANKTNWTQKTPNKKCELTHINFGLVLGEDGKRIRSRDGGTLKLLDLFEETIKQTEKVIRDKNPDVSDVDIKKLAIGSIKYADLKSDRRLNYKFSYEKMLSFTGNTLCYIMYGYLRTKKVIEKYINTRKTIFDTININELNETDFSVIKYILKFPDCTEKISKTNEPNHLTTYLYELVELVHQMYKLNRVMDFDENNNLVSANNSRVNIFIVSNKIILEIFKILNIQPIEFM